MIFIISIIILKVQPYYQNSGIKYRKKKTTDYPFINKDAEIFNKRVANRIWQYIKIIDQKSSSFRKG